MLGEHHDAVVADRLAGEDRATSARPPEAYALGMLAQIEARSLGRRAASEFRRCGSAPATRALRRWL